MSRFGLPQNQLIKFAGRMAYLIVKQSNFVLQKKHFGFRKKTILIMICSNTILDCICVFFFTLKYPCKIQLKNKFGYLVNLDIVKSNQNPTLIIFGNLGFFPVAGLQLGGCSCKPYPTFIRSIRHYTFFIPCILQFIFVFFLRAVAY